MDDISKLYIEAKKLLNVDAASCVVKLRILAEKMVVKLYEIFRLESGNELAQNISNIEFRQKISSKIIINKFHFIRKIGNSGAHEGKVNENEAQKALEEAENLINWFCKISNNESIIQEALVDNFNHIKQIVNSITLPSFFDEYNFNEEQKQFIQELDFFLKDKQKHIFLLKGYAGTGKTYLINALKQYFDFQRRETCIFAPTGRAAKILQKKVGAGRTIHSGIYNIERLIESSQDVENENKKEITYKFYFKLKENEHSSNAIYIIDEASMISDVDNEGDFIRFGSGRLLKDLIDFINIDINIHNKKIIFIGDNAQLPPINMNFSPALDALYLYQTYKLQTMEYELKTVVRQNSDDTDILNVSLDLRKSLEKNIFNKINIKGKNIFNIEYHQVINEYVKEAHNNFNQIIMIAHSNEDTQGYNKDIRKKLGKPDIISIDDRLIVTKNISINGMQIMNGDFVTCKRVSQNIERKNIPIKDIGLIELKFREIEIEIDTGNNLEIVPVKLLENTLDDDIKNSKYGAINQALYIDFKHRFEENFKKNTEKIVINFKNQIENLFEKKYKEEQKKNLILNKEELHEKAKKEIIRVVKNKSFTDALRSDLYFNSLRANYGYCITCHKSQGGEWKKVFVKCKTKHSKQSSRDYFRWLYTAITRSSEQLFILDAPNFTPYSKMKIT